MITSHDNIFYINILSYNKNNNIYNINNNIFYLNILNYKRKNNIYNARHLGGCEYIQIQLEVARPQR